MANKRKEKQLSAVPAPVKRIKKEKNTRATPKRRYDDMTVDEAQRSEFVAAMRRTGCDQDPVCVLRKKVTSSDTSSHHCRFLLPRDALTGAKQLEGKHLHLIMSEGERKRALEKGLDVKVLGRSGIVHDMTIRYLFSNKAYRMIRGDIMRFVAENRMREGQVFELWACREDDKLKLGVLNYDTAPRPDPSIPAPAAPVDRQESPARAQEAINIADVPALVAGPVPPAPAAYHQILSARALEANIVDDPILIAREREAARSHRRSDRPISLPLDDVTEVAILLLAASFTRKSNQKRRK